MDTRLPPTTPAFYSAWTDRRAGYTLQKGFSPYPRFGLYVIGGDNFTLKQFLTDMTLIAYARRFDK